MKAKHQAPLTEALHQAVVVSSRSLKPKPAAVSAQTAAGSANAGAGSAKAAGGWFGHSIVAATPAQIKVKHSIDTKEQKKPPKPTTTAVAAATALSRANKTAKTKQQSKGWFSRDPRQDVIDFSDVHQQVPKDRMEPVFESPASSKQQAPLAIQSGADWFRHDSAQQSRPQKAAPEETRVTEASQIDQMSRGFSARSYSLERYEQQQKCAHQPAPQKLPEPSRALQLAIDSRYDPQNRQIDALNPPLGLSLAIEAVKYSGGLPNLHNLLGQEPFKMY